MSASIEYEDPVHPPVPAASWDSASSESASSSGPTVDVAAVDESARDHLARQWGWHVWMRDGLDESPSWLVSLIVHLILFLIVTSVAIPWTPPRRGGSGTISLTLGFADRTQAAQGPEVTLDSEQLRAEAESANVETAANPPPPQPAESAAQPHPSAAPVPQSTTSGARQSPTALTVAPSFFDSPYAALLNRRRPSTGVSTAQVASLQPLSDIPVSAEQQAMNRIVDDFIEYDIGKLRGAAGAAARSKFAKLGPDALPALVRGLNKAAGIHASCPVGVIAGKLIMTLRKVNDPSMTQYAINNIGVGVSEDAPHFNRLAALRKNWLGAPSMPPNVEAIVTRLESRQEGELMELMLALSDAPSDTIVAALRSGDEYLGAAATLAVLQSSGRWDAQQSGQLRAAVLYLRANAKNPQIRQLAVDAHRRLTR